MFIVAIYDQTIVKIDSLKLSYKKSPHKADFSMCLNFKPTF